MVAPVPPPDTPRPFGAVAGQGRRRAPQQTRQTAGQIVCRVVQLGGDAAEVEVLFVFVAQHAVHGVDGLVGQRQRCPADEHIQQRRDHAVAGIFGHGLHGGFGHTLSGQILGVAAHDTTHSLAGCGQVAFYKLFVHVHALLRKALCGQCLPAPEHLYGQPQPRAEPCCAQADKAGAHKGAHRQAKSHDAAAQQFALGRFGQAGAQALFQRGDGLAHEHHRVGQPRGVAEEGVQHKAAQNGQPGHTSDSLVYCTVFTRCSTRLSAQSAASSTKPPALGPHHS